ncbi:DsrE family protein [Rubeoparvulum massiliense]|uniref:DsrE family protein n=1 Tax=Rubeoparvulum massiliense TaxID=1631346 RepID=UPI00065DDDCD|nr:DsrE family protein [Rubeoparvulum massiliense]
MKNRVILLQSDRLGTGDEELGEALLENFFTILKQEEEKPVAIFCLNRGVFTLTAKSVISLQLKALEKSGVSILACKTCIDYYGLQDQMTVGELSSMKHFIELANQYEVLTL